MNFWSSPRPALRRGMSSEKPLPMASVRSGRARPSAEAFSKASAREMCIRDRCRGINIDIGDDDFRKLHGAVAPIGVAIGDAVQGDFVSAADLLAVDGDDAVVGFVPHFADVGAVGDAPGGAVV